MVTYFAATGTHPLLSIDIAEANYLLPPPDSVLSSTDLISQHAITLQKCHNQLAQLKEKVYKARIHAAVAFEKQHECTINNFDFKLGNLVLVRTTVIEKALNCKMRLHYLGPLIIISRNKGGAFIILELNGSVFNQPIAAFHVIPYFACAKIDLPPLNKLIDISQQQLQDLKNSEATNPEDEDSDAIPDPSDPLPID